MKETLAKIWNEHSVQEDYIILRPSEQSQLVSLRERNADRLRKMLDEKGKQILEALLDSQTELEMLLCEEAYANGFSFCAKILIEALG